MSKKITISEFNNFFLSRAKDRFDAIGPTAWTVAYRRTFSNIPYARALYQEIEKYRVNLS